MLTLLYPMEVRDLVKTGEVAHLVVALMDT